MTPKEKAKELVDKFRLHVLEKDFFGDNVEHDNAKQCALIAVDEILDLGLHEVGDYRNDQSSSDDFSTVTWYINYWQEVKQHIQQL
jgi:hypothetical protein